VNRFYSVKGDLESVFSFLFPRRKAEFQWFYCFDFVRFYGTRRPERADGWMDWGTDRQRAMSRGGGGIEHDWWFNALEKFPGVLIRIFFFRVFS